MTSPSSPRDSAALSRELAILARQRLADNPSDAADLLRAALILEVEHERPALRIQMAQAQWAAGSYAAGDSTLRAVIEDPQAAVEVRRAAALPLLTRQLGQFRLHDAALTVGALLRLPGQIDPEERALLALLADGPALATDRARLAELGRRALAPLRKPGLLPAYTSALLASQVSAAHGLVDDAITQLDFAITVAPPTAAAGLRAHLALVVTAYDISRAKALRDSLRTCPNGELSRNVALADMFAAACAGQWADAARLHTYLLTTPLQDPLQAAFHAYVASMLARARTDASMASEVDRLITHSGEMYADDWFSRINRDVAQANAELARSDLATAAQRLADAVTAIERSGAVGATIKLAGHVATFLDAGRGDDARRLADLVQEAAQRHPSSCMEMYCAWKDAALTNDPDRYLAAAQAVRSSPVRPEFADIHERAGRTLLAARRRDEAIAILREAAHGYEQAHAWAALSRVRNTLRRCGVQLPAGHDTGAVLTRTERAVVDLTRSGLTNAAIARRLEMSVGTVGTHLSRIYRKAGIRSRVELIGLDLTTR